MDFHLASSAAAHLKQFDADVVILSLAIFAGLALWVAYASKSGQLLGSALTPYLQFAYNNFIKPHDAKFGEGQQSALESFYARQVGQICLSSTASTSQLSTITGQYL